jgi:hypothetical protein
MNSFLKIFNSIKWTTTTTTTTTTTNNNNNNKSQTDRSGERAGT